MNKLKTSYSLRIPSQTDNLELIRQFVSNIACKVGFDDEEVNKIELAVDEACTNVMEHAYAGSIGDIDIAVKLDTERFTVIVTDHGKSFEPEDVEMPDMNRYLAELRVGGLGIYLMKTLMDEVEYVPEPGVKNEVRMVKYFLKKS